MRLRLYDDTVLYDIEITKEILLQPTALGVPVVMILRLLNDGGCMSWQPRQISKIHTTMQDVRFLRKPIDFLCRYWSYIENYFVRVPASAELFLTKRYIRQEFNGSWRNTSLPFSSRQAFASRPTSPHPPSLLLQHITTVCLPPTPTFKQTDCLSHSSSVWPTRISIPHPHAGMFLSFWINAVWWGSIRR